MPDDPRVNQRAGPNIGPVSQLVEEAVLETVNRVGSNPTRATNLIFI